MFTAIPINEHTLQALEEVNPEWGMKNLSFLGHEHKEIQDLVAEVMQELEIKDPPYLLIHEGSLFGTVYFHKVKAIAISDKSLDILTIDEFKALMAHELDHHMRAQQIFKMDEARNKLKKGGTAKEGVVKRAMELFDDYIEFSADNTAANQYGAKAMAGALKKLLIAGAEDLPVVRHSFFPEIPFANVDTISRKDISKRLEEIAAGVYKPKGYTATHSFRRFERLNNHEADGRY